MEPYSFEETKAILLKDNYWKTLHGQGCNRTLRLKNPRLFESIYYHTTILEQKMKESGRYASTYNFTHRILFIVERNGDIEGMKCSCGRTYSWTGHCRRCSELKNTLSRVTPEQRAQRIAKQSQTMRLKVGSSLQSKGLGPRYDRESIQILEAFGKSTGLNLQHAENGGEVYLTGLGYYLDGYDKEQNIVVEIDEPFHFRKEMVLLAKDQRRHLDIQQKLRCKIYRLYFNKRTNRLVLYNSPDQPENWDVNKGIELTTVKGFAKNGTKQYNKYTGSEYQA